MPEVLAPALATCALCPRLCRHACPVATGTGREAAVPAQLATVLLRWERGELDDDLARAASTLCVDCGACQDACHLHRPLPELLRQARGALLPAPQVAPLAPLDGDARRVVVHTDDRAWADAMAARLGEPVAATHTSDAFGLALRGHAAWDERRDALARLFAGRTAVVAHGGAADALRDAGVAVVWLHDLLGPPSASPAGADSAPVRPSCACGGPPEACCGGAGPLAAHHPDDAARMARRWYAAGGTVADARCGAHLATVGLSAPDVVDRLLEGR